mmetsp:Transcript_17481/g.66587  ORF Transcript_17481/g.66587 Transcript_17481/m.66587 type:complete len:310 (-) Transcript_17481:64-993(-)
MITGATLGGNLEEAQPKNARAAESLRAVRQLQALLTQSASHPEDKVREWCVAYFEPKHFDAVVIERALERRCGLPSCCKLPLSSIAKRNRRKLYVWRVPDGTKREETQTIEVDVEDVERFCSRECYVASLRLRQKIPQELVTLRKAAKPFFEGLDAEVDFRDPTVDDLLERAFALLGSGRPAPSASKRRDQREGHGVEGHAKRPAWSARKPAGPRRVLRESDHSKAAKQPAAKLKRVRFGKFDQQVYNRNDTSDKVKAHADATEGSVEWKPSRGPRRSSMAPLRYAKYADNDDNNDNDDNDDTDDTGQI